MAKLVTYPPKEGELERILSGDVNWFVYEIDSLTPCVLEKGNIERRKINRRILYLVEKIIATGGKYFSKPQQEKLLQVLRYAAKKHTGVYRKDKITPYIHHPLEVASLIIDLKIFDYKILIAAILHDIIEDTKTSPEEIAKLFGAGVSNIVYFVSKNKKIIETGEYWSRMKQESDLNYRWRILVLKFADRIHYFMTSDIILQEKKDVKIIETKVEFEKLFKVLKKTFSLLIEKRTLRDKKQFAHLAERIYKKLLSEINRHT
ncbi:MAG: HD domain-containing protein [Candidatus Nomurabacteria bacterium]